MFCLFAKLVFMMGVFLFLLNISYVPISVFVDVHTPYGI
jgi:hypothetical protein